MTPQATARRHPPQPAAPPAAAPQQPPHHPHPSPPFKHLPPDHPRCGAVQPPAEVLQRVEFRVASHRAKEAAFSADRSKQEVKTYVIPTVSALCYTLLKSKGMIS